MHKIQNATEADVAFLIQRLTERGLVHFLDQVCESRNVTRLEIAGKGRARRVVRARQELWSLIRGVDQDYSFHEIGNFFRRHHSTIAYGIEAHHERSVRRAAAALQKRPSPDLSVSGLTKISAHDA
jgi:chromosomal replication initiation ATPase DnaA